MKLALLKPAIALLVPIAVLCSCSEEIDDSNLYTFTGEMMTEHFQNNPEQFSSYYALLKRVHPSKRSESTMAQLLQARGHYTCFAPTNKAIDHFLDSMLVEGKIDSKVIENLPDSVANPIVFNSIIDNQSAPAYATTDFSVGALTLTNMNDRYINISFDSDSAGVVIYVNSSSKIIDKDIEVENGYIHAVDKVLSPSTVILGDILQVTPNTHYFGYLLKVTGWDKKMSVYRDEVYENDDRKLVKPKRCDDAAHWKGIFVEHRYFGFTAFVETDSVFQAELGGFSSEKEFLQKLNEYIRGNAYYNDNTVYDDDYQNPENAVNQFVAYHLLPERLIWNKLVIYSNEKGFSNESPNDGTHFSTNVWEYYETLDPHRRSVKITGTRDGKFLNRHSIYDINSYREKSADITGLNLSPTNGAYDNAALNGYYYPIDGILIWSKDIPNRVLNERLRYNICALLPELMTNNCRRVGDSQHRAWYFLNDYFEKKNGGSGTLINVSNETDISYLTNTQNSVGWVNYQLDEFNIAGSYDFTMKLPPVPYTGTYEIRYGMSVNGNRGMAQIYIGTNPNKLPAVGIPIDLRIGYNDNEHPLGWYHDAELGNDDAIEANDKMLRNMGYIKGPKYFYPSATKSAREYPHCLRRIIFMGQLEEGKTYYIRFKSVLESTKTELFYDYLEFVPKTVYNGDEPEDKW